MNRSHLAAVAGWWVLTAILLGLAYQMRAPLKLRVGGDDWLYAAGYLRGFYSPLYAEWGAFRATNGKGEVRLRGLGEQTPLEIAVRLNTWQPAGAVPVMFSVNGVNAREISSAEWKVQRVVISDTHLLNPDELVLGFQSETYIPAEYYPEYHLMYPTGIAIDSITLTSRPELAPAASLWERVVIPSWWLVGCVALLGSLAYLAALWLAMPQRWAFALAASVLVIFAVLVAFFRISAQAYLAPVAMGAIVMLLLWNARWGRPRGARLLLLVCVLLLGWQLRLNLALHKPIDVDEQVYVPIGAHYADLLAKGEWSKVVNYTFNAEHPVFVKLAFAGAILAARALGAGDAELISARAVAVTASTLLVALLALLNPLAGAALALHAVAVQYGSEAYLEAVPALSAALAVVSFERARTRGTRWLYLSALLLGITAASKYIYAVAGFALAPFILARYWRRPRVMLSYGLIALGAFLLADPILWPDPAQRLYASLTFHQGIAQSQVVAAFNRQWWWHLAYLSRWSEYDPGIPFVSPDTLIFAAGILGLPSLWRRSRVYVAWFVCALLFLSIWQTKWEQYALTVISPWCLAAGWGATDLVAWLARKRRRRVSV